MVKPEAVRFTPSLSVGLRRAPEASLTARTAVGSMCERLGVSEACRDTLLLLVAEVINNAVLHSDASPETPILFDVSVDAQRFRVEVNDGGGEFAPHQHGQSSSGGWGLRLLEMQAENWGVERIQGTLVWFELARHRNAA
jgi:anti-sigma regulatory factor (Ser/Thr protein kinase)